MSEPEIYCPLCTWRPAGSSRWLCAPRMGGCGTQWNTFWTGGVCPGCSYRWEITVCLTCKQFSLHEDWYHWPETASDERRRQLETEQP
ncbi:hypothetical protein SAMN05216570_0652 [Dyella sp. OK004]|uniref:hypothetical protein n=1 Tax=Dyella sp. OK004 TaxID=1855292 RepID=UPI0008DFA742|nr:hypothetical protein [Dyella sp. OK004]SFR92232.1 hypothetical protein SAMN05216570_0652 [Dyella sp. OK004]